MIIVWRLGRGTNDFDRTISGPRTFRGPHCGGTFNVLWYLIYTLLCLVSRDRFGLLKNTLDEVVSTYPSLAAPGGGSGVAGTAGAGGEGPRTPEQLEREVRVIDESLDDGVWQGGGSCVSTCVVYPCKPLLRSPVLIVMPVNTQCLNSGPSEQAYGSIFWKK